MFHRATMPGPKPVPGYPHYSVTVDGHVISTRGRNGKPVRILKPGLGGNGYLTVALWDDGVAKSFYIHRLVIELFGSKPDPGCECRHYDGNRFNNHARNLVWGTRTDNMADMIRHGRTRRKAQEN